jgi:hypothetical protein
MASNLPQTHILGFIFVIGNQGGVNHYLCEDDIEAFRVILPQKAEEVNSVTADAAIGCNKAAIRTFFERVTEVLTRPECMIINEDETQISSRKRFKVVVPDGFAPLKRTVPKMPHFSAMCTISGSASKFPPVFLLPGRCSLPFDLVHLAPEADFLATQT